MIPFKICFICLLAFFLIWKTRGWELKWLMPNYHCKDENERSTLCISDCSTCDQRDFCITGPCTAGCDCDIGYFRLKPGEKCVFAFDCPRVPCPENEVFRACGPRREQCGHVVGRAIDCSYKCFCKAGYRRDSNGTCIPEHDCPQIAGCSFNEERRKCGLVNEFCGEFDNSTICEEKCYCLDNHKRNIAGVCINNTFCQPEKCFAGESLYDCVPTCDTTCDNYGDENCVEDEENCYSGCFCSPGTVMDRDGLCKTLENCRTMDDSSAEADAYAAFIINASLVRKTEETENYEGQITETFEKQGTDKWDDQGAVKKDDQTTVKWSDQTSEKLDEETVDESNYLTTIKTDIQTTEKPDSYTNEKENYSTTKKQNYSTTKKQHYYTTEKQSEQTTEKHDDQKTEKQNDQMQGVTKATPKSKKKDESREQFGEKADKETAKIKNSKEESTEAIASTTENENKRNKENYEKKDENKGNAKGDRKESDESKEVTEKENKGSEKLESRNKENKDHRPSKTNKLITGDKKDDLNSFFNNRMLENYDYYSDF